MVEISLNLIEITRSVVKVGKMSKETGFDVFSKKLLSFQLGEFSIH